MVLSAINHDITSKANTPPGVADSRHNQLKKLELYKEYNYSYLADEIIRLYGLKYLEILLLETSGCFGSTDRPKIAFDHHKGLFGVLAMLRNITDEFSFASMNTFTKCKIFSVRAAGENIYLWSLLFEPEGSMFELWQEHMVGQQRI
ncbi:hypothetical protein G6F46_008470 [Rhizopus delemar]|uniref:Uncharacterized protein n=2 Tax=Rhizopus TaxID=4842 RepID=A0A9P6YY72_9FUNG|nr:hypothetical protein G6F55_007555 [Rhizopus delemar]KAG1539650.1 hypothetical protein G6F51_009005 [Rhizopus arrhizus]KAG1489437.1 hypothetical protein G6F54_011439 [Rhizopus delemar]KAG1507432.1 hypothetical protein G6F52_011632 [Rhizopus delemar]KAG1507946.1 hypothetical protein G6F53_008564 [Rhizopus delemar]